MVFAFELITIFLLCQLIHGRNVLKSEPPPPWETALTARYIIHAVDWVTLTTISIREDAKGFPLGNIKSVSDGPLAKGTGVPYFYLTPEDISSVDLEADNRCSISATLAQTDYCTSKSTDPQDPKCPRLLIAGRMEKVKNTTSEFKLAQKSLFERHPDMANWPPAHHFFIAKINISTIMVLDYTGRGMESVTPQDYFKANTLLESHELQKLDYKYI